MISGFSTDQPTSHQHATILIGNLESPEFEAIRKSLDQRPTRHAGSLREALAFASAGAPPVDLIVLLQSWPGEFDAAELDELRRLAPLASVVNVLGSWCESETRSGNPLPGTLRLHWHEWPTRHALDNRRAAEGICPSWGLPATATEEDRSLLSNDTWIDPALSGTSGHELCVGIFTARQATWDWLSEACRSFGYQTTWLRPGAGYSNELAAVLWDCQNLPVDDVQLTQTLDLLPRCPHVLAICTFPRATDLERLNRLGVRHIAGQPLRLDDLQWQLAAIMG